jgi:hypothetical protein
METNIDIKGPQDILLDLPQERLTSITRGRGPRRGNLESLLRYWRPIMKKPGGFRRCLVILANHPELYPLERICAWLHHETTGLWPNEGNHHKRGRKKKKKRKRRKLVRRVRKAGRRKKSLDFDNDMVEISAMRLAVRESRDIGGVLVQPIAGRQNVVNLKTAMFVEYSTPLPVHGQIEVKKRGLVGSSDRIGQTVQAAGSILLPGDMSDFRSPIRSQIYETLTPGGGRGLPSARRLLRDPTRGARNKFRCPPGFQKGGTFTNREFSTCGAQILGLPSFGPGSPSEGAQRALARLARNADLVRSIGDLRKNRSAYDIVRAAQIPVAPKKGSPTRRQTSVDLVLNRIKDQEFGTRFIRRDGVILEPVVSLQALGGMDEFDDMVDGSLVDRYTKGQIGKDLIPAFGAGLRDIYVGIPDTNLAVKVSRVGGELKPSEMDSVQRVYPTSLRRTADLPDPSASIYNLVDATNGRFKVEIGEIKNNQFNKVTDAREERIRVESGGLSIMVPRWVYETFLSRSAPRRAKGDKIFEIVSDDEKKAGNPFLISTKAAANKAIKGDGRYHDRIEIRAAAFADTMEVKKSGLVGSSSRLGQAAGAGASILTPGDRSPITSPIRSGIARGLTPGGGGGVGGRARAIFDPGINMHRCPPGTRNAGQFTDSMGRSCGYSLPRQLVNNMVDLGVRIEDRMEERRRERGERGTRRQRLGEAYRKKLADAQDRLSDVMKSLADVLRVTENRNRGDVGPTIADRRRRAALTPEQRGLLDGKDLQGALQNMQRVLEERDFDDADITDVRKAFRQVEEAAELEAGRLTDNPVRTPEQRSMMASIQEILEKIMRKLAQVIRPSDGRRDRDDRDGAGPRVRAQEAGERGLRRAADAVRPEGGRRRRGQPRRVRGDDFRPLSPRQGYTRPSLVDAGPRVRAQEAGERGLRRAADAVRPGDRRRRGERRRVVTPDGNDELARRNRRLGLRRRNEAVEMSQLRNLNNRDRQSVNRELRQQFNELSDFWARELGVSRNDFSEADIRRWLRRNRGRPGLGNRHRLYERRYRDWNELNALVNARDNNPDHNEFEDRIGRLAPHRREAFLRRVGVNQRQGRRRERRNERPQTGFDGREDNNNDAPDATSRTSDDPEVVQASRQADAEEGNVLAAILNDGAGRPDGDERKVGDVTPEEIFALESDEDLIKFIDEHVFLADRGTDFHGDELTDEAVMALDARFELMQRNVTADNVRIVDAAAEKVYEEKRMRGLPARRRLNGPERQEILAAIDRDGDKNWEEFSDGDLYSLIVQTQNAADWRNSPWAAAFNRRNARDEVFNENEWAFLIDEIGLMEQELERRGVEVPERFGGRDAAVPNDPNQPDVIRDPGQASREGALREVNQENLDDNRVFKAADFLTFGEGGTSPRSPEAEERWAEIRDPGDITLEDIAMLEDQEDIFALVEYLTNTIDPDGNGPSILGRMDDEAYDFLQGRFLSERRRGRPAAGRGLIDAFNGDPNDIVPRFLNQRNNRSNLRPRRDLNQEQINNRLQFADDIAGFVGFVDGGITPVQRQAAVAKLMDVLEISDDMPGGFELTDDQRRRLNTAIGVLDQIEQDEINARAVPDSPEVIQSVEKAIATNPSSPVGAVRSILNYDFKAKRKAKLKERQEAAIQKSIDLYGDERPYDVDVNEMNSWKKADGSPDDNKVKKQIQKAFLYGKEIDAGTVEVNGKTYKKTITNSSQTVQVTRDNDGNIETIVTEGYFRFRVYNEDGDVVEDYQHSVTPLAGGFRRIIHIDDHEEPHVYHSHFGVNQTRTVDGERVNFKQGGFGDVFNNNAIMFYRGMGLDRVKVSAAGDGEGIWPRQGFRESDSQVESLNDADGPIGTLLDNFREYERLKASGQPITDERLVKAKILIGDSSAANRVEQMFNESQGADVDNMPSLHDYSLALDPSEGTGRKRNTPLFNVMRSERLGAQMSDEDRQSLRDEMVADGVPEGVADDAFMSTGGKAYNSDADGNSLGNRISFGSGSWNISDIEAPNQAEVDERIRDGNPKDFLAKKAAQQNAGPRLAPGQGLKQGHVSVLAPAGNRGPHIVEVGANGLTSQTRTNTHVRNGGSLIDVPDDFLLKSIINNLDKKENGVIVEQKRFEYIGERGGINGIRVYKDRETGALMAVKYGGSKSFFANEAQGEMAAGLLAQRLGFAQGNHRMAGPIRANYQGRVGFPGEGNGTRPIVFELGDTLFDGGVRGSGGIRADVNDGPNLPVDSNDIVGPDGDLIVNRPALESGMRLLILDKLIANRDRHGGNYMWAGGDGDTAALYPIDNGAGFDPNKFRTGGFGDRSPLWDPTKSDKENMRNMMQFRLDMPNIVNDPNDPQRSRSKPTAALRELANGSPQDREAALTIVRNIQETARLNNEERGSFLSEVEGLGDDVMAAHGGNTRAAEIGSQWGQIAETVSRRLDYIATADPEELLEILTMQV